MECYTPCSGDPSQICGASWRMNVFNQEIPDIGSDIQPIHLPEEITLEPIEIEVASEEESDEKTQEAVPEVAPGHVVARTGRFQKTSSQRPKR